MNRTTTLIAAVALTFLGTTAMAQDAIPATWANEVAKPVTSTVSRAEVGAGIEAARQAGDLNPFDSDVQTRVYAPIGSSTVLARTQQGAERVAQLAKNHNASGLSREQVRADVIAARKAGELNTFDNLAYLNAPVKSIQVAPASLAQAAR